MDILVGALLAWIGANSQFDTAGIPHPDVVTLSPEGLTQEFYTGVPHLLPEDGVDERINALYSATDGTVGTIYILDPEMTMDAEAFEDTTENPLWREILLHELVHHVQWQTGAAENWACHAAGEKDAYHLGGVYLREVRAADPLPYRNVLGHLYSRCPSDR